MEVLAERMRVMRERAGLTKTALAQPRYTVSYVSQIEAGRRRPSAEAMKFFAERLGVTPRYLATGVPDGLEDKIRYEIEDVRQLIRGGHADDARELLRRVLGEAERYELAGLRAEGLMLSAELLVVRGSVRDAIDQFEEALKSPLSQRQAGMAISGLARAYRSLGDLAYSVQLVESFLSEQGGALEPVVLAELKSVLVSLYFERGDMVRAEMAAQSALAAAEQGVSPEIRANAYWDASRVFAERKQWDEALQLATRARLLMEEMQDRRSVARLHNVAAFICLEEAPPRIAEARKHLDQAEAELQTIGAPADMAYVLSERARLALVEGQPDRALTLVAKALEDVGEDALERGRCLFLQGRALSLLGRGSEAQEVLGVAAEVFRGMGARQQEAACWRETGEIYLSEGRMDEAVAALRTGLNALDPARSRA